MTSNELQKNRTYRLPTVIYEIMFRDFWPSLLLTLFNIVRQLHIIPWVTTVFDSFFFTK